MIVTATLEFVTAKNRYRLREILGCDSVTAGRRPFMYASAFIGLWYFCHTVTKRGFLFNPLVFSGCVGVTARNFEELLDVRRLWVRSNSEELFAGPFQGGGIWKFPLILTFFYVKNLQRGVNCE